MVEPEDVGLEEILFEFKPWGRTVRVAAIDPVSGTEVVIVGDPMRGEAMLKRVAARKLAYVIDKRRRGL